MVNLDTDQTDYEIDLILHDNPKIDATALASHVAEAAGVATDELEVMSNKIRLTANQDKLGALAALDGINRIEEVREKTIFNDHACVILHTDTLFTTTGYRGNNQMVCVADTGFDQGIAEDSFGIKVHPAFDGRIEYLRSLWTVDDYKDQIGHGTHVCGSICGSGIYNRSGTGTEINVNGTAPGAKLMVQSLAKSVEGKGWIIDTPADLGTSLFSEPYELGIRIHNNSWGNKWKPKTGQFGYEADATAIDRFISDHPDFTVLVAAGNNAENHGASQVGANAAAKNCITVGASGTTRPNDGQSYSPQTPAVSGITDTAIFSSRGPTLSTVDSNGKISLGRIKPDVVAPGVAILSAASRLVTSNDRLRVRNGPSDDQDWLFMSGTSQATPLVAGCVALLREALKDIGKEKPSSALIKALLVNGAVNHSSSTGLGYDYEQGFGLVDIDKSIAMIRLSSFIEGGGRLETTKWDVPALRLIQPVNVQWESEVLSLPNGPNRLVATLAYPDGPGALLQSDVNLIARAGDEERHGNMGSGAGFDRTSKSSFTFAS